MQQATTNAQKLAVTAEKILVLRAWRNCLRCPTLRVRKHLA